MNIAQRRNDAGAAAVRAVGLGAFYPTPDGYRQTLDQVDLSVHEQEFVAIIGPSGCGKSTFLRVIADLHPARDTTGDLMVCEASAEEARRRRNVAFMFQRPALLPWLSVLDNVRQPLKIANVRDAPVTPEEMLARVGLTDFKDALPRECSGGMQQRAALARSLILAPSVLLLDEPFGSVDEITREVLNAVLLEIWHTNACAVLFVTHAVEEAVFLADRVVVMSSRPARIKGIVSVDLPRPRHASLRTTIEFFEIVNDARRLLTDGADNNTETESPAARSR